jgi:hypothetical protein
MPSFVGWYGVEMRERSAGVLVILLPGTEYHFADLISTALPVSPWRLSADVKNHLNLRHLFNREDEL